MKAILYMGPKHLEFVTNIAKPVPSYQQVLVETKAVGICGSDLGIFEGEFPKITPPLIIGHEGVGIVRAIGDKVTTVKKGDHVAVSPVIHCGRCEACKQGKYNLCSFSATIGMIDAPGEYADFFVTPEQNCYLLPKNLPWTIATLVDTLAGPVYGMMRVVDIPIGSTIAVFGPGPAGLFFCRLAKLRGASKVYLIGTREERLRLGVHYGADITINIHNDTASKTILEHTQGKGVDVVIDAAGSKKSLTDGFTVLRRGGTFLAYGVYPVRSIMVDMQKVVLEEFLIFGYSSNNNGYPGAIELLSTGKVDGMPLITHTFNLEELPDAFSSGLIKDRRDGYIKGIVVF
jgi:threonine dehydrogenase-like Zn-dependent dehydrogenase